MTPVPPPQGNLPASAAGGAKFGFAEGGKPVKLRAGRGAEGGHVSALSVTPEHCPCRWLPVYGVGNMIEYLIFKGAQDGAQQRC